MKKIHIIGLLLIALSIGYFIINLSEEASEYANFTTAIENPEQQYHVVGMLSKSKTQYYDPIKNPNYFEFYMTDDKGIESKVVYKGAKPEGFDQTEKIVVAGNFEKNQFLASQILMKCPSKYVDEKTEI